MDLRTLAWRLMEIYRTSPNPARDIEDSSLITNAREEWDNADEVLWAVEVKAFEAVGKDKFFRTYLSHTINHHVEGLDNGFSAGSYHGFKFRPYMDQFLKEEMSLRYPGWHWESLPFAPLVLRADIIAIQAKWEWKNATTAPKSSKEWRIEETFLEEYWRKTLGQDVESIIGKHFERIGEWDRLRHVNRVKPELQALFES